MTEPLTERRTITTERGSFHVRLRGPADGIPLVLVHGWPESGYCWHGVADALPAGYRLIMPDLRGLGDSERTLDVAAYAKQELAFDMLGLLDALGVDTFALVGHDWGGAVVQEMALAAPERVTHLVLLNIRVLPNARANRAAEARIREHGAASYWYQFFLAAPNLSEAMIPGNERAWLGYFLNALGGEFPADAVAEYERCYAIEHTPATAAAYYRSYRADARRWAEVEGQRFAMPGLYLYGRHDPVIIPEFTQHLGDVFDEVRLVELESLHFVQEERPAEVAALIHEFVAGA